MTLEGSSPCGSTKYFQVPADGTCQSTTQNLQYRPKSFYLSVTPQLTCSDNGYGMPAQTGAPKLSGNIYAVCCRP